jgi:hypothetical protein
MASLPVKGEYPIQLGTLLFTMVEPERGVEVEYNRWYEHDHFYSGCMIGPWQFAGDRFVATRRLKDLRYPAQTDMTPDPLTGSYLAIYWVLAGHHDDWNRWAVDQVNLLHSEGRMFDRRQHVHTLLYEKRWSHQRDPNGCTIELALDHDYPGLVVVCGDVAEGHTHDEVDDWFRGTYLPDAMAQPWGPDLVGSNTTLPLLDDRPADVVLPEAGPDRFLQFHFLDHDPEEGWADGYGRIGAAIDASGIATHVWTAPFVNTVFGTDTYTDELW